ncbi:MAG: PAS domain-containing protein, partial [Candidatus Thorarchaeota archaeon]
TIPGHPIHTYMSENKEAQRLVDLLKESPEDESTLEELKKIVVHYIRLQNQLFPLLEKAEITGPSTVMWAKQDEIREMLNKADESNLTEVLAAVEDMIYKEENILFPMSLENLSEYDWVKVRVGEEEIGYAWIDPGDEWKPITPLDIHQADQEPESPGITLNTGNLTLKELDLLLRHIPVDLSFVGVDEKVKYYSATDDRIFPRSPGVIGRSVINCHPQKSFDKVQRIMDAFKAGTQDKAVFWIELGGKFLVIAYYAVKDDNGTFVGTLEVSQDVTEIRSLDGEKRLLDWE